MRRFLALLFVVALTLPACEPAPIVGASCMYPSDCRRPLACRFERCRNACTLNQDCPLGTTCLLDARGEGSCGVPQDQGCTRGADCDPDLACVLDRCMARCRDATDCPADGVCALATGTSRVCFDALAELPDAALSDR